MDSAAGAGATATAAGTDAGSIHIFFFPHPARGHTIPLIKAARLFAQHPGVHCTFVTTPGNSSYIIPTIDEAKASGLPLDLLLVPFPYAEVGLPPGIECTDVAPPGSETQLKFAWGQFLLHQPYKELVAKHRPDCIIADCLESWISDVALSLSIPYFVFSIFPASAKGIAEYVYMMMKRTGVAAGTSGDQSDSIVVGPLKGLPHRLELTRAELPLYLRPLDSLESLTDIERHMCSPDWLETLADAERKSCGIIFNTVYELEPEFVDHYTSTNLTGTTMNVWCVGPVQLYESIRPEFEQDRGREIKYWLDSKEPESVLYICFGSECHFTAEQLREIAVGLQSCKHCFIWVVRRGGGGGDTIDEWLPKEFLETVGDRGLILTEWVPQIAILNHTTTGGFLTQCGWNSTIEAVCAGLPLIAWPLHFDQFITERVVVEVLGIGLRILHGAEMRSVDVEGKGLVKGELIREVVDRFMGGGDEEVRTMRVNVKKYQELARSAMKEEGSSYVNLSSVIELIKKKKK